MEIVVNSTADQAFLNLLFAGFLSENTRIQALSSKALHHWAECSGGDDLIPVLEHIGQIITSPAVKMRTLILKEKMATCPTGQRVSVQDVLLAALATDGPLLLQKAYEAAAHLPDLCSELISAAVDNRRRPDICCRYLVAAGETGGRPSPQEWTDLLVMFRVTKNLKVRATAAGLIHRIQGM